MTPYPKFHRPSQLGFTLLETIVALAVILAALVGPVALITRGIFDFSFAKNKITAANLAQEGIELVRAVRDNNIACDILNGPGSWPWNSDPEPPYPPTDHKFVNATAGISTDRTIAMDCGGINGASIIMPILSTSCGEKLRFDSATGLYGYTGSQETIFSRCVTIKVPPDSPDAGIPAEDQMDVVSTVTWDERGAMKNMSLRERFYNWR
ncbi:MAG: type II secretion system protein [Candidatus Sungbacteria bacterium]|nr:type II secretion system protein [Candidatus Sungbacteria bacterium]